MTDLAYRICNKVADYILEGATFETDQTSFDYDKKNDSARLVVDVTILPPEKVFAAIEEYVESVRSLSVDVSEVEAEAEASFQYILSMIDDIQPVTASIPIEFYYNEVTNATNTFTRNHSTNTNANETNRNKRKAIK